jgi:hypothetical protein
MLTISVMKFLTVLTDKKCRPHSTVAFSERTFLIRVYFRLRSPVEVTDGLKHASAYASQTVVYFCC